MDRWYEEFQRLDCELILLCTDDPESIRDWINDQLGDVSFKAISSVEFPDKLGILKNGRCKRASVFVTPDGEITKLESFELVGRSFEELFRMLYAYKTGNYCAEGWKSYKDGFLDATDNSL